MMVWSLLRPLFRGTVVQNAQRTLFIPNFINHNIKFQTHYCTQPLEDSEELVEKTIKEVSNGDLEKENKMRLVLLEIDVLRQDGKRAPTPSSIKKHNWERFLNLQSRSGRQKYMQYLFDIEMKTINTKIKQQERAKQLAEVRTELKIKRELQLQNNEVPSEYGLQGLSMFLRIYESSMNKIDNARLHTASMFGQPLVIDCSYDSHMTYVEQANAGNQMTSLFSINRQHRSPFDIHFCNVNYDTESIRMLHRNIPTMKDETFPINIHTESYLDLFPKGKLVYLTPHCKTELTEFDHDAVYIIGCMVDKGISEPLSLAKAKENNLKVAKFPLDRYMSWSSGSGKSLTLDQVTKILLSLKATGDWNVALKHVPRRKVIPMDVLQNRQKQEKLNSAFTYTGRYDKNYNIFQQKKQNRGGGGGYQKTRFARDPTFWK